MAGEAGEDHQGLACVVQEVKGEPPQAAILLQLRVPLVVVVLQHPLLQLVTPQPREPNKNQQNCKQMLH